MRNPTKRSDPAIEQLLAAPDFAERQHEIYGHVRSVNPVYWCASQSQWLITSFELVDELLTNPAAFSSVGAEARHIERQPLALREAAPLLCEHFATSQLNISDPPDHTRLRRAFNRAFLPRRVDAFRPRVRQIADELVRYMLDHDGPVDVVSELASPLPVMVIAEFMGIDPAHRDQIRAVTFDQRYFFGLPSPSLEVAAGFEASLAEWHRILQSTIDDRQRVPRHDVMTTAAQLVEDGTLSAGEAIATCLHLLIAGNSTTTGLIGNLLHLLLVHPQQLSDVAAEPTLASAAVEEALRFEPPLPTDRRVAVVEYELGGVRIEAGDRVACVLAAACRDPEHFDRPDEFDIHRSFNARQQAAFGRGIHLCLGAPLARLEAEIVLQTLLEHAPQLSLADGYEHRWHDVATHRGPVSLEVESAR